MSRSFHTGWLRGDGTGPEVTVEAVRVLRATAEFVNSGDPRKRLTNPRAVTGRNGISIARFPTSNGWHWVRLRCEYPIAQYSPNCSRRVGFVDLSTISPSVAQDIEIAGKR